MAAAIESLRFDPQGVFLSGVGIAPDDLESLDPALETARQALLGNSDQAGIGHADQPQRMLADYRAHRQRSEVGQILAAARRLAELVDCLVVVAGEPALLAIRALKAACCHPYHNELSRAERGGQPRMYFAGDSLDNDALAGLVDLLSQNGHAPGPAGRWGLIAIAQHDDKLETPTVLELLVDALRRSCSDDLGMLEQLTIGIAEPGSWSMESEFLRETFTLPAGAAGALAPCSAAGLLPAAVLGIDVRRLLEGTAAMHLHFLSAPPAENIVLQYSGVFHLLGKSNRSRCRQLVPWAAGLAPLGAWYENLLTSNRHSAGASSEPAILVNLLVDHPRRDRLAMGARSGRDDSPDAVAVEYVPEIQQRSIDIAREANRAAGRLIADLHLRRLDASALGHLFQMLTLATSVECELNPKPIQDRVELGPGN